MWRDGDIVTIRVKGEGFLYNMVRIIAGTLIQVGNGQYPPERVKKISMPVTALYPDRPRRHTD